MRLSFPHPLLVWNGYSMLKLPGGSRAHVTVAARYSTQQEPEAATNSSRSMWPTENSWKIIIRSRQNPWGHELQRLSGRLPVQRCLMWYFIYTVIIDRSLLYFYNTGTAEEISLLSVSYLQTSYVTLDKERNRPIPNQSIKSTPLPTPNVARTNDQLGLLLPTHVQRPQQQNGSVALRSIRSVR